MKIWVYLNGIQQGPYSLEEIMQLPVTASTPVWYEGLPQWMPANEAPATAMLFESVQPRESVARTFEETTYSEPSHPQASASLDDVPPAPPTFIGWSVFIMICCFPIGGLLGIILSVMSGNYYKSGDYDKATRMSEFAEWSVILSIVIGLMTMPLAFILF